MAGFSQTGIGNRVLASLSRQDFAALAPHLIRVPFGVEPRLDPLLKPLVIFPEGAVAAMMEPGGCGRQVAVTLTGREGVIGTGLLADETPREREVLVFAGPATALVLHPEPLRAAVRTSPALALAFLRALDLRLRQTARNGATAALFGVPQRLARLLLMLHDRLGPELAVTHGDLATILGSRRASVTDALHLLEGERAIRNVRHLLGLRDRAALEAVAGSAYGLAEWMLPPAPALLPKVAASDQRTDMLIAEPVL